MLAITLCRRDFREFDQIITLYTKEKGKVEALARGVKKIISKNSAALEPFCLLEAEIIPGKEIDHLAKAQATETYSSILKSLPKISALSFALEFANLTTKLHEPDEKIFILLVHFLRFLNKSKKISSIELSSFVIKFLILLGFAPELNSCLVCGKSLKDAKVLAFSVGSGGVVAGECVNKTANLVKINQNILNSFRVISSRESKKASSPLNLAEAKLLNRLVYKFAEYHAGHKIPDWQKLAKFSEIL